MAVNARTEFAVRIIRARYAEATEHIKTAAEALAAAADLLPEGTESRRQVTAALMLLPPAQSAIAEEAP